MVQTLHTIDAQVSFVVFCAYGMPWQKRTLFKHWWFPRLSNLTATCQLIDSKCQYSGKRHVVLEGTQNGIPPTLLAQPYPKQLCARFARLARSHFMDKYVNMLDSGMQRASLSPTPRVSATTRVASFRPIVSNRLAR